MEKIKLPFSVTVNDTLINELDISIPNEIAANNLEASNTSPETLNVLLKKMTIGKKLLLERCKHYEELVKYRCPKDIINNEQDLIEKNIGFIISTQQELLQEIQHVS